MFLRSRRRHYKRGPRSVYHRIDSRNLHSGWYNSDAQHTVMLNCYNVHARIVLIPITKDASLLLKVRNLFLAHAVCFMFPDTQRNIAIRSEFHIWVGQRMPGNAWASTNMRTFFYSLQRDRKIDAGEVDSHSASVASKPQFGQDARRRYYL